MTDYTIQTNFGAKDSLPSGNAAKVVKGSEFTTEFTNIATAVNSKADSAGDTFTGVVNFSDDIAVNTNTLFVDVSAAKVGIGTTSPANTLTVGALEASTNDQDATVGIKCNANHRGIILQENDGAEQWEIGVGESGALKFYDSGSATSTVTFQDGTGNVGIGTDSPDRQLTIANPTDSADMSFISGNAGNALIYFADTDDDNIGAIGYNHEFNFMNFRTNDSERMRITSTGSVGIGTDAPSEKLVVKSGTYASNQSGGMALQMGDESGSHWKARFKIKSDGSGVPRTVISGVANASGGSIDAINISNAGNVGIGASSPDGKLDIEGDFEATKALVLTNTKGAGKVSYIRSHGADGEALSLYHDGQRRQVWDSRGYIAFEGTDGAEDMRIDSAGRCILNGPNYTFQSENYHLRLTEDDGSCYLSNVQGGLYIGSGGYYYGSGQFQLTDGATSMSTILCAQNGNITFSNKTGGSANSVQSAHERMRIDSSGNLLVGTNVATTNAKLKVDGAAILDDSVTYTKNYSYINTTGQVVAKATGGNNGSSTTFIFTGQGGTGTPFHIVYAARNQGGYWSAVRSEVITSGAVDVVASSSGTDVLFTFKSKSGSQGYSPKVKITTVGSNYDTTYLA